MLDQGLKINVDWKANVARYEDEMEQLQVQYESLYSAKTHAATPDYYKKPFHAYDEGNLSWQAAMEVESAALTVHAPIFTPDKKTFDRQGDWTLRNNFHLMMKQAFAEKKGGVFVPKRIVDIGCSTGLSTLKLAESFPEAEIIGVDLSPYMLAVAKHELLTKPRLATARRQITYLHGAGEDASIIGSGNNVDMVSVCLVSHELPASASTAVIRQAFDMLKSGGAIAIMDIDPKSPSFVKLAANAFAFQAFQSTEPWVGEYIALGLEETLKNTGFVDVSVRSNSPRHRTVVAFKP